MYTWHRLIEISRDVDASIFIFGEDDKIWWRGKELQQPRDNVLVEYGLFVGTLGPERALICRTGKPKTPSDLDGIVHIDISNNSLEDEISRIEAWLNMLNKSHGTSSFPLYLRDFIRVASDDRNAIGELYKTSKYSSKTVDILGLALTGVLHELSSDETDAFVNRVLLNGTRARLMFVSPNSSYLDQRSMEDGDSVEHLQGLLKESVRLSVKLFVRLRNCHQKYRQALSLVPDKIGAFDIRITDYCPYFTIYRTDELMLWGLYTASVLGLHSSVLHVREANTILYRQMLEHFNSMWTNRSTTQPRTENYILRCHSHAEPILNERLVEELLGEPCSSLLSGST